MKITKRRQLTGALGVGAAGVLVLGLAAGTAHATPNTASSQILAQATVQPLRLRAHGATATGAHWGVLLASRGQTDGYVVDNKFAPGQSTGWHSHWGPSLIFVVSGTVTNYESSSPRCRGRSYSAGASFTDPGGTDVHMLRNEGTVPAETIAVQLIPSGQPRRVDAAEPARCQVKTAVATRQLHVTRFAIPN